MYNGIGLTTPRGSGTNGFVTRNLSAVRKTKEKIQDAVSEDKAVRPHDPELIEHERRRQIEVRCLELRVALEDEDVPDDKIEEQVTAFRAKLIAEKKSAILRDSSGRPMYKDSHELSVAQEHKNERAKSAFGIRDDFVPGSSLDSNRLPEKVAEIESTKKNVEKPEQPVELLKDGDAAKKSKSKKSSKKRRHHSPSSSSSDSSSSSSSSSSSDSDDSSEDEEADTRRSSKKKHKSSSSRKEKRSKTSSKSKSRRKDKERRHR